MTDETTHDPATIEQARKLTEAFRSCAAVLITEGKNDPTLVGSAAIHAGLERMLSEYGVQAVGLWLHREADDLMRAGSLAMLAPPAGTA